MQMKSQISSTIATSALLHAHCLYDSSLLLFSNWIHFHWSDLKAHLPLTVLLNVFHWFAIYWVRTNCLALHIRPFMIFQKISLCPSRTSLFPGVWSLLSHLWVAPTLFFIILIFIVNLYGCFKTFSGVIQAVWFMEHFLEFSNTGCMPHFSHHTTFYFN